MKVLATPPAFLSRGIHILMRGFVNVALS